MQKSHELVVRVWIIEMSKDFISEHFILGYGSNTLEQITHFTEYVPRNGMLFQHTHNIVLEEVVRYGLIGAILFFVFLWKVFMSTSSKAGKWLFCILLIFSLFQIYYKEFYYVFFISLCPLIYHKGSVNKNRKNCNA